MRDESPEEMLKIAGVIQMLLADPPQRDAPGNGGKAKVTALSSKRRAKNDEGPPWLAEAICDDRGRVLPVLANLMLALRNAPEIAAAFTFDEMMRAPILTRALPVDKELGTYPRPVRDTDISQLQEWLQR